jgi:hypothetical protein
MEKHAAKVDPAVYQELALRFSELGKLFRKLGMPKATQTLIESLVVGDRSAFNEFVNQLDLPLLDKCYWLRDVVERVICTVTSREEYRVRNPLTRLEAREYARILSQHSNEILFFSDGSIVPGPFLDDLIKAGLATKKSVPYKTCAFEPVLSPPEQVCL